MIMYRFQAPFSKCFPSTRKLNASVFKFLQFEERFRRVPYRDGLVRTVGLTAEIELCFKYLRRGVEIN